MLEYTLSEIDKAAEALRNKELVAFPTETVFGLGAIANDYEAVAKVFAVKGRPSDNPLIVHISRPEDIFAYAISEPKRDELIQQLITHFWPGPLTLVVPIVPGTFPENVTGGLDTVGIRLPNHRGTQKLIDEVGIPLVGPSANLSGKPSPTRVEHVRHDLDGKINGVLSSEPSRIGVESTVLDVTDPEHVQILRPGFVTKEMLQKHLPELSVEVVGLSDLEQDEKPKSPGMKYRHYSPSQPVIAVSKEKMLSFIEENSDKVIGVLANTDLCDQLNDAIYTYPLGDSVKEAMQNLYTGLRFFDELEMIELIVVEWYPETSENAAYCNRLEKASSKIIY